MAQFDHPELGGMGQWSPGMTMIGAMSDTALKARVEALFRDLAGDAEQRSRAELPAAPEAEAWWPRGLGEPASTGAQNGIRYAHFPQRQRLAVWRDGAVTLYNTAGRSVTGFGQQQGTAGTFSLTGLDGPIDVEELSVAGDEAPEETVGAGRDHEGERRNARTAGSHEDALAAIERLAELHRAGALTDGEFSDGKKRLLSRIG